MNPEETYSFSYESPLGNINVEISGSAIASLVFAEVKPEKEEKTTALAKKIIKQLNEYFKGERKNFDLPLVLNGTLFQKKVWDAVSKIEYGKPVSYLDLAKKMGSAGSIRAIGAANARNKLLILIPCHRVIGSDGALVGYAGGIERKKWLLDHEGKYSGMPMLF